MSSGKVPLSKGFCRFLRQIEAPQLEWINAGCGRDWKPGWTNTDVFRIEERDQPVYYWNIEDGPFERKVSLILLQDVFEHLNNLTFAISHLKDSLVPWGLLCIRSPHFTSRLTFADPTHFHGFALDWFRMITLEKIPRWPWWQYIADGEPLVFERVVYERIVFERRWFLPWNWIVEPLVNLSDCTRRWYEASLLRGLFPAYQLEVILQK